MGSMKVHQFSRGLSSWDNNNNGNNNNKNNSNSNHQHDSQTSLSLSCKRLRPLAPKVTASSSSSPSPPSSSSSSAAAAAFDLKSFIRPETFTRNTHSNNINIDQIHHKRDPPQVETQPGGTRWNPTQEQIGILEMLYRGGMRTPNAHQIEHITSQLSKFGKIEGKNVFYWFQNHKARERQKQKRNNLLTTPPPPNPLSNLTSSTSFSLDIRRESMVEKESEDSPYKRTCRSWGFESLEMETKTSPCSNNKVYSNVIRTLELFPLHPELGKSS